MDALAVAIITTNVIAHTTVAETAVITAGKTANIMAVGQALIR